MLVSMWFLLNIVMEKFYFYFYIILYKGVLVIDVLGVGIKGLRVDERYL